MSSWQGKSDSRGGGSPCTLQLWEDESQQAMAVAGDHRTVRSIIVFHTSKRGCERASQLWARLPTVYRTRAMFAADEDEVYHGVILDERRKTISKKTR